MKLPATAAHSASLEPWSRRRPRFRHHSGWLAGASALGALTLILAGCRRPRSPTVTWPGNAAW